jgi:hypothetical protein
MHNVHLCVYVCVYVCGWVHVCVDQYVYMYVCMYVYTYVYIIRVVVNLVSVCLAWVHAVIMGAWMCLRAHFLTHKRRSLTVRVFGFGETNTKNTWSPPKSYWWALSKKILRLPSLPKSAWSPRRTSKYWLRCPSGYAFQYRPQQQRPWCSARVHKATRESVFSSSILTEQLHPHANSALVRLPNKGRRVFIWHPVRHSQQLRWM